MDLIRVATNRHGTFGVLLWRGLPFAVTLEQPWRDNQPNVSCIPSGVYKCLRCRNSPDYGYKDSPKFGDTFQVYQVPGRSTILFHAGNLSEDSRGCILVGEMFEPLDGQPGIQASRKGFEEFLRLLADVNEFPLSIRWAGEQPVGVGLVEE